MWSSLCSSRNPTVKGCCSSSVVTARRCFAFDKSLFFLPEHYPGFPASTLLSGPQKDLRFHLMTIYVFLSPSLRLLLLSFSTIPLLTGVPRHLHQRRRPNVQPVKNTRYNRARGSTVQDRKPLQRQRENSMESSICHFRQSKNGGGE